MKKVFLYLLFLSSYALLFSQDSSSVDFSKIQETEVSIQSNRVPLLLNYKDGNKKNWKQDNLELLCYNCYFLYIGDVYNNKQILAIEDYVDQPKTAQVDWELDEYYKEHLKQLGLIDEKSNGEEFINYL
jgi:hypothetical protein